MHGAGTQNTLEAFPDVIMLVIGQHLLTNNVVRNNSINIDHCNNSHHAEVNYSVSRLSELETGIRVVPRMYSLKTPDGAYTVIEDRPIHCVAKERATFTNCNRPYL